jgi:hypothetical protein
MATYHHGGTIPEAGRVWVTKSEEYAQEYADMKGGSLCTLEINLAADSILDLTDAEYDAEVAAEMLRDAGIDARGCGDEDTHCVVNRLSDAAIIDADFSAVKIAEWTDCVGECISLCVVTR